MTSYLILGLLALCFTAYTSAETDPSFVQHEATLYDYLLSSDRYNPKIRPIYNATSVITVTVGLTALQIVDVHEESNMVELNVWSVMYWTDFMLAWNKADYNDITEVRLPHDRIWMPDISLFNSGDHTDPGPPQDKLAVVSADGGVLWIPKQKINVACNFNMRHFPFDSHTCKIKMGSWTYHGAQVNVLFNTEEGKMNVENLSGHPEWKFTAQIGERHEVTYPCCPDQKYVDLTFFFKLERKAGYYDCIFVAPAIFLAALVPMLFVLGPNNKFSLGAGMIISLAVFVEVMENKIPVAHGSVPVLAQYYIGLFGLTTLALILSTITANLAERASYRTPPPAILRSILLDRLASLLCVKETDYVAVGTISAGVTMQGMDEDSIGGDFDNNKIMPSRSASSRSQWRAIAATLDRIFFIVTVISIVIFSFVVTSRG